MTRRRGRAAALAVGAAGVVALVVDPSARPVVGSPGEIAAGVLVTAAAAGLVALVAAWGPRRAAFLLLPLLAAVAAVELGLRWWFPRAPDGVRRVLSPAAAGTGVDGGLYRPHHYTLYTLNERPSSAGSPVHHRLGVRDGRDLRPDPAAVRIVFVGGSTTYTVAVGDDSRIFTARLERELNRRYAAALAGRRFEVVNAGLPGATSAENLIRLELLLAELEPDLVVIQHGLNDGWARAAGDVAPDYANYRRSWGRPPAFRPGRPLAAGALDWLRGRSMVVALAAGGMHLLPVPVVGDYVRHPDERLSLRRLEASTSRYFERNTRSMVAVARSLGAEVVLATVAVSPAWDPLPVCAVAEHNGVLARVAARDGVPLFDFAAVMPTGPDHMPDGRHVSERGSDVKADLFLGFLVDSGIADRVATAPPPCPVQ